jgi:hypothetical protein
MQSVVINQSPPWIRRLVVCLFGFFFLLLGKDPAVVGNMDMHLWSARKKIRRRGRTRGDDDAP